MHSVQNLEEEVEIPCSVPGLVTRRLLVMNFLDGEQITRLKDRTRGMSEAMRRRAQTLILRRVADAYGQMILGSGLFQADPHGGNIMVMKGGPLLQHPCLHLSGCLREHAASCRTGQGQCQAGV